MLNAEMIIEKGIKPEDLYCVRTSDDDDEFDFKAMKWAIYEQKDDTRVGGLTIPEFYGKPIKPIEIWLCCDKSYAIYKPTKDIEFTDIRKVNVLVMNTCPLTSSDMIALKAAIYNRFDNNSHLVDVITTLDRYMEIHIPMHFDYFVFMDSWGDTIKAGIVEKLYFASCPWEYAWKDGDLIPINHQRDIDTKLKALEKEIRNA